MSDIATEIFKKYGAPAIIISLVVSFLIWGLAHFAAGAGTEVSVLWGLVKYTKPAKENSEVLPNIPREGHSSDQKLNEKIEKVSFSLASTEPISVLGKWDMRWESVDRDNIIVAFKKGNHFLCGTYSYDTFNGQRRRYGCIKGDMNENVFHGEWFESEKFDVTKQCEKKNINHEGQITLFFSVDGKTCSGKYSRLEEGHKRRYVWSGIKL